MSCVLLVDDEPLMLSALRREARRAGVDVRCASSGQEALEALADPAVVAVLSDFRMPNMNGAELLREVRTRRPEVACILHTAEAEPPLDLPAGTRLVPKPAPDGTLASVLRAALERA